MQIMNRVTKDRIRPFGVEYSEMGLAVYFYPCFGKRYVDDVFKYFDIRTDKRRMWEDKFASVVPCIDGKGKIRDVWTMLFDYRNGIIVRRGDARTMVRNTDKQNSAAPYHSQPEGSKQWSSAHELMKGYNFINDTPTLFGMNQAQKSNIIYIFEEFIDAAITQILCRKDAACVATTPNQDLSILLHPNIVEDLRGKQVKIYPQYGSYKEAKKVEYELSCLGVNVTTDTFIEELSLPKRKGESIATVALNMIVAGFAPIDAILFVGLLKENNEPF